MSEQASVGAAGRGPLAPSAGRACCARRARRRACTSPRWPRRSRCRRRSSRRSRPTDIDELARRRRSRARWRRPSAARCKIDPAPVLALLPRPPATGLEHVGERPERAASASARRPCWYRAASAVARAAGRGRLLLLVGAARAVLAAAVGFDRRSGRAPTRARRPRATPASRCAADGVAGARPRRAPASNRRRRRRRCTAAPAPRRRRRRRQPRAAPAGRASAPAAPLPALLQSARRAPSWIEVTDARGKSLLSRTRAGRARRVGLDGALPLRVTIGNAAATRSACAASRSTWRRYARDNVARFELKHDASRRSTTLCAAFDRAGARRAPRRSRQASVRLGRARRHGRRRRAGARAVDDQHRHGRRDRHRDPGQGAGDRRLGDGAHHGQHARGGARGAATSASSSTAWASTCR